MKSFKTQFRLGIGFVFYIISTAYKNNLIFLILIFFRNHFYFVIKADASKFATTYLDN